MSRPLALGLLLLLASGVGCGGVGCSSAVRPAPGATDARLAGLRAIPQPPPTHWSLPPEEAADALARGHLELLEMGAPAGGKTGARKATVRIDGAEVDVKWRAAPIGTADSFNNSPRRELAAFAIQRLILPPDRWVVPPIALRCLPLDALRGEGVPAVPTLAGARCVLGTVSLWLEDVEVPEQLLDEDRFWSDPVYARSIADYDVLTYLIKHQDGKPGNALRGEGSGLTFSVDNGISFGGPFYNYPADNWDDLRVPALPRDTVERVRALGPEDLDALAEIARVEHSPDGFLRVRQSGDDLVFGLNAAERAGVARRARRLVEAVDEGVLPTF